MKFAITATDRFLGVFEAFVKAGWQPLKLFTVPLVHNLSNQQAVIAYAQQFDAGIQLSRMTELDMAALAEQGCEALIVASYDWKILNWQPYFKYAINFHSSPLPLGRGPYPVPRAIFENRPYWGITCHQVTPKIDQGPVLSSELFPLHADECHESLDLKIQMAAKRLAYRVAQDMDNLWHKAQPQSQGIYWPRTSLEERIINFHQPVENILRHIRAYGITESIAYVNQNWFVVKRAVGWTENHSFPSGELAHVFNRNLVITAQDGYIGLLDNELVPPQMIPELQACLKTKLE